MCSVGRVQPKEPLLRPPGGLVRAQPTPPPLERNVGESRSAGPWMLSQELEQYEVHGRDRTDGGSDDEMYA